MAKIIINFPGSCGDIEIPHNLLDGLQGGQEGEYFHLTQDQYNSVLNNLNPQNLQSVTDIGNITNNDIFVSKFGSNSKINPFGISTFTDANPQNKSFLTNDELTIYRNNGIDQETILTLNEIIFKNNIYTTSIFQDENSTSNIIYNLPSYKPSGSYTIAVIEDLDEYIPLIGTDPIKPITGILEFNNLSTDGVLLSKNSILIGSVDTIPADDAVKKAISQYYNGNDFCRATLLAQNNTASSAIDVIVNDIDSDSRVEVRAGSNSRGLSGANDFTPNITDLDYVQKKYIDQNFIPISGTDINNPVTGTVEFEINNNYIFKSTLFGEIVSGQYLSSDDNDNYYYVRSLSDSLKNTKQTPNGLVLQDSVNIQQINKTEQSIEVSSVDGAFRGLSGAANYTTKISDLDYVQKIYVDEKINLLETFYQPLNSDLTSIATLSTTSFGRNFLTLADASAARSYIGAGTGNGSVTNFIFTNSGGFTGFVLTGTTTPTLSLTLQNATTSQSGQLTNTDWNIFNNKQTALSGTGIVKSTAGTISYLTDNSSNWDSAYTNRITSLTTTGSNGSASLLSNILNIPTYTLSGLGGTTLAAVNAQNLSVFSATTSSQLAGVISDKTGSGLLVFNNNPILISPILTGVASPSYSQGKLVYDTDNESLTFFNNDSSISLQIGQEQWIRVKNTTGSTISNGAAVYINGSSSGLPTIALAQADSSVTSIGAGLATESIANNAIGYVTSSGLVNGLDTSSFSVGAVYISSTVAGGLTQTPPSAPNFRYRVGFVTNVNATTGKIHVTQSTASLGNGSSNQIFGINNAGTAQEVKSLLGTSNRLTATNATNSITFDISSTFEALLGKVANPLSQFASTTSAQLASVLSDESGTGVFLLGTTGGTSADIRFGDGSFSTGTSYVRNVTISTDNTTGSIAVPTSTDNIRSAIWKLTNMSSLKSGQSIQSGNGVLTSFTITHGLAGITSTNKVFLTARSVAASGWQYVTLSSTQITIIYTVAPANAASNLTWDWQII